MPLELAYDLATLALYDIVIFADDSGSMIFEEGGERINDLKVIMGRVAEVATLFDEDGTSSVCNHTCRRFSRQCHVTTCQSGCTSRFLLNLSSLKQCTVAISIAVSVCRAYSEKQVHVPFCFIATMHVFSLRGECTLCHACPVQRQTLNPKPWIPLSWWCACLQVSLCAS